MSNFCTFLVSIFRPQAQHPHGLHGSRPHQLLRIYHGTRAILYSEALIHYKLDPTIFSTLGRPSCCQHLSDKHLLRVVFFFKCQFTITINGLKVWDGVLLEKHPNPESGQWQYGMWPPSGTLPHEETTAGERLVQFIPVNWSVANGWLIIVAVESMLAWENEQWWGLIITTKNKRSSRLLTFLSVSGCTVHPQQSHRQLNTYLRIKWWAFWILEHNSLLLPATSL